MYGDFMKEHSVQKTIFSKASLLQEINKDIEHCMLKNFMT